MLNQKAFSLVEVMVAAVVFMVSVAGIYAAVGSMSKTTVAQSADDIKGSLYGQRFLESLRAEVGTSTWSSGVSPLFPGTGKTMPTYAEFPGYSGTYDVVDLNGVRKVTLNITTPTL